MNTKVWYLPYTRMIETFSNANARMIRMVHSTYYGLIYENSEEGHAYT